ncbi:MAG: AAA family ATPase [Campylobacteraceae bacterium]|nr:AAA family ATPase [Campylobacteraceae bacterium]
MLKLNSLNIQNYRNLKKLTISTLDRVNLITGKNNTGKSTILEAIAIYATNGSIIDELLFERGEYSDHNEFLQRRRRVENEAENNTIENNIKTLSSLFTDRLIGFDQSNAILIGHIENTLFGEKPSIPKSISLGFKKYTIELAKSDSGMPTSRKIVLQDDLQDDYGDSKVGFEIKTGNISYDFLKLDSERFFRSNFRVTNSNYNIQFIKTKNINKQKNGNLFDKIALTGKEKYIIDALKIIEPSTERIAFIESDFSDARKPVIKLSNSKYVLPLQSMGDGINRILTIILALVNADNGFLLIDEFENGLHYSVQKKLWKTIFELAKKLNVQVFATTHSSDCIDSFGAVLNDINDASGKLIRLENNNNGIECIEFNANELKIASERNIEIR